MHDFKFTFHAAQDIGNRENQEDAWGLSSGKNLPECGQLFVVCDGMGGMDMGERFSALGVECMTKQYDLLPADMSLRDKLAACWEYANNEALNLIKSEGINGSSTLLAVAIRGRKCCFLSVGDSRILLHRGGESILLTRPHTLGEVLDIRAALDVILKEDAKFSLKRAALTNGLGMANKLPDICSCPFQLVHGDRIVMMSDGVFNTLDDEELRTLLNREATDGGGDGDIAHRIISAVKAKGAEQQDNCTVLVIDA